MRIKLKKERVLLSDLLPYETPITFSNRFLYEFVIDNEINVEKNSVTWKSNTETSELIICMILGIDLDERKKISTKKWIEMLSERQGFHNYTL